MVGYPHPMTDTPRDRRRTERLLLTPPLYATMSGHPVSVHEIGLFGSRVESETPIVAAVFLVAMVALIFAGGVSRVFGYPLNWSTDAATCLFAWACFLCADIAWRRNGLMSIELVTSRLSPRGQRTLEDLGAEGTRRGIPR